MLPSTLSSTTSSRLTILALLSATSVFCFYQSLRLRSLKKSISSRASSRRSKILCMSQTGTTKSLASRLQSFLSTRGFSFDLVDVQDYDPEDLAKESLVLIMTCTWEDGKAPPSAGFFSDWVDDSVNDFRVGSLLLNKCKFAVFGVGSRAYGGHFNAFARGFSRKLKDLGAEEVLLLGEGDVDEGKLDMELDIWGEKLVTALKSGFVENGESVCASVECKPWYFMFTSSDDGIGYAYDPSLRKWHSLDLPNFVTSNWFIASSCGLVCFMDNETRSEIYICNPITKHSKLLIEPPGLRFCDYSALAISVNRVSQAYSVSIVKSRQVPDNFYQWDLSIHIYNSETATWMSSLTEVLSGWRGGDESVICNGSLYFMIYSTGAGLPDHTRHGIIRYSITGRQARGLLMKTFIRVPCSLTCGRLMNLKEKVVMVGGIGKQDRSDIIKGIGIWVLNGAEWEEIARMPHKLLQGFGELDDVFASSGTDDLI